MITSQHVENRIRELKSKGVEISPNLCENLGNRPHWWALHSTITVAEIVGENIGFENLKIEPTHLTNFGDVDLFFQANNESYWVQVKSPEFFRTQLGENTKPEIDIFYNHCRQVPISYVAKLSPRDRQVGVGKVNGKKSMGFLLFEFDIKKLRGYITERLKKASRQLRDVGTGFKIIAVDIRYYPIGDYEFGKIIEGVQFNDISCILAISYDFEKRRSRLVPFLSEAVRDKLNAGIFNKNKEIQLYSKKMFLMPIKADLKKGGMKF